MMESGRPVVYVNESMWNKAMFDVKSGLAETFDCAIAGPGKSIPGTEYRGATSGKVLGVWDGLKLIPE